MYLAILVVFVVGYLLIALEHTIKIDKAAIALLTGTLCWTLLILGGETLLPTIPGDEIFHFIPETLRNHIGDISEILFFLLGAMTIVEIIDAHEGFSIITDKITTKNRITLLWILCFLTFFLSAVLDNLTTAIVMATLLRKLISNRDDLLLFAGMVIIAANAGGAFSPIGDVTTIMLWIGGQVTTLNIITSVFLPSFVCLLIPLTLMSFRLKGTLEETTIAEKDDTDFSVSGFERKCVFALGIGALLFVPVFKTLTHLPPFMGILFGLSAMWILTELLHRNKPLHHKHHITIVGVLTKIDTPSILFFLGILVAVSGLQTAGHLADMSEYLDQHFHDIYSLNAVIGVLSSIIDNVPLVAGAMGMYPLATYPVDHNFWELLAFCAGTGGSILIIGSAAGVAIMGILKINFVWYLKRISWLAFLGYVSGIVTYILLN